MLEKKKQTRNRKMVRDEVGGTLKKKELELTFVLLDRPKSLVFGPS